MSYLLACSAMQRSDNEDDSDDDGNESIMSVTSLIPSGPEVDDHDTPKDRVSCIFS